MPVIYVIKCSYSVHGNSLNPLLRAAYPAAFYTLHVYFDRFETQEGFICMVIEILENQPDKDDEIDGLLFLQQTCNGVPGTALCNAHGLDLLKLVVATV